MKQKLIVATLAICLITLGSSAANARYRGGEGYCSPNRPAVEFGEDDWRGQYRQPRHEIVNELLGLNEEQEAQIDAIRAEEWLASQVLREKLRGYREQMRQLTDTGTFDEKAIRAVAEEKGELQVELAVSKARMHSRIHAIMNPEQQELAAKLRAVRKVRKDRWGMPRRGFGGSE